MSSSGSLDEERSSAGEEVQGNSQAVSSGNPFGTRLLKEGLPTEMAGISFEVLASLKESAKLKPRKTMLRVAKRQTKNRPIEISSKQPISPFRDISVDGTNKKWRDPRFSESCGRYNKNKFRSDFSFIYDETLPAEKAELKKKLKEAKTVEEKEGIRRGMERVTKQIEEEQERRLCLEQSRELKKRETEAVKEGKKPFYVKRSQKKRDRLIKKFESLKESGRLDRYLKRRRAKIDKRAAGKKP